MKYSITFSLYIGILFASFGFGELGVKR